jgi:EmrB/QacA subfamily drug resistance transporter
VTAAAAKHPQAGNAVRDSRWIALYVLCLGMLMIVLDVTVVNVALPSIQEELHFSTSSLAWVVNAYLIAFGGLLLLAGRFGDLIGRRSIFLAGIAVFTAASLLCGLAHSQSLLVGARFIQGIGGAMTSAVILGMIVTMFPEPREQAKAIGVYAFVASAGGAVGLLAGGVITQSIDWHWIFFVNVPIGLATALVAARLLERDPGIGFREGADVPGAALITGALMLGVYTIVKPAADHGWGSGRTLSLGGLSLLLLLAFTAREATAAKPLIPLRIFRSRTLVSANAIQVLSVPGMFGMFFLGALYLRRVLGYDALEIGLAFLPVTIAMGLLSIRYAEQLITRFGARGTLVPGLALIVAGLAVFARSPVHSDYLTQILPAMLLLGIGAGVCFPALMNVAMSGAGPRDAGLASGLVNTTAQVGGALGLAVLATLSTSHSRQLLEHGHSSAAALTGGYHLAFWIAAALAASAIAVAATVRRLDDPMGAVIEHDHPAVRQPCGRGRWPAEDRRLGQDLGAQRARRERRHLNDPGEGRSATGGVEQVVGGTPAPVQPAAPADAAGGHAGAS